MADTALSKTEAKNPFTVIILAGISGAGKTTVINVFEDMQFFTIDGMPFEIVPRMLPLLSAEALARYRGIVVGIELSGVKTAADYAAFLNNLRQEAGNVRLLFVNAQTEAVIRRYATTRRPHPLEVEGLGLEQAVEEERHRLEPLRELADFVFDTTDFSIHDIRRHIQQRYATMFEKVPLFRVHLISFGFKYGQPADADMVYDLRFLPNPYFDENLRPLSGKNAEIAKYVLDDEPGKSFIKHLSDFLNYLLPLFEAEGRYRLTVAFGCTGGRHRSVAVTEAMGRILKTFGFAVSIEHRHLELG